MRRPQFAALSIDWTSISARIRAGRFHLDTGEVMDEASWNAQVGPWLPTEKDMALGKSLMKPVYEAGKYATWIAPPAKGLDDKGIDYEYVKMA